MNKESKAASISKNTSIFFPIEQFIQRQTKKTFVIGALICMSATAMSAIASPDGSHQTARNLISSNSHQQTSNLPRDVQSLREQLVEKTRELQEYKASIFRASHPQDHAKITELNQRIAQLEKNKQELIEKINARENELARAKKQMNGLEVASDALTDYIQKQRNLVEAEKKELLAKIQAYEEDTQLENERSNNEKLMIDLVILMDTIATYESHISELEENHNKELQDALQDAALLKFELADKREKAHRTEHELMVSSLNYMTIAHDLRKSHKKDQRTHKSKLNLSEAELAILGSIVDDLKNENERIQKEYDRYVEINIGGKEIMEKHFASRHVLANQILEKDEALNAALLYYEQALTEQAEQLQALKENLAQAEDDIQDLMQEKESLIAQHSVEKQTLDVAIADGNEMIADTIQTHKQIINEHLAALQELQGHLELENLNHHFLHNEKNQLAAQLNDHKQLVENTIAENLGLAVSIREKEDELMAAMTSSEDAAKDYLHQIEKLSEKLAQEEKSRKSLQTSHDELLTSHLNTNDYFESTLQGHQEAISTHENTKQALHLANQEMENAFKSALSASEETANEYLAQIQVLKEKLAQEEETHTELQKNHQELTEACQNSNDTYNLTLQEKEEAISSYEKKIEGMALVLKEKEEDLKIALTSSENSSKEYLEQIYSLKEELKQEQETVNELKRAHDKISVDSSLSGDAYRQALQDNEDAIAAHKKHILSMNVELNDREEALKDALIASEAAAKQYIDQIDQLSNKLHQLEEALKDLKETHEELSANHNLSTEYFERSLQEKEEALKIAMMSSNDSSEKYTDQINSLKEKLSQEEESLQNLKKEHAELSTIHSISLEHFERALQEKEEALRIALMTSEDSSKEYTGQINSLKEKLAQEEESFQNLKKEHEELSAFHSNSLEHFERALHEKDEHLTLTTTALKSSIAEHMKHIEDLKENLAMSENAHSHLKNTHEDLGQKLSQTESEKHALANA
ncbi:MAG TPA: hypothetical protein VGP47_09875, partial [Parachlamydiaceae bacterium]|nr:hypothetical protein [Parachlamydiaceae bacterium]